jgi:hypothetical protein
MTSWRGAEWRQLLAMGGCISSGTCLQNSGTSRTVGHELVASRLLVHHLIAKAVKKLP